MKKTIISREAGFTLVELMMVIFVVGIMAGLVVMTVGGNSARELKKDATRIQQLLVMAQDEATFSGREIGFFIDSQQKSYGFLFFDDKQLTWEPLQKEAFMPRELPDGVQLSLAVDGELVDLKKIYKDAMGKSDALDNWLTADDSKKDDDKKDDSKKGSSKKDSSKQRNGKQSKIVPALIFFSDGHYTAFRLQVSSQRIKDVVFAIDGDGLGTVHMSDSAASRKKPTKRRNEDG